MTEMVIHGVRQTPPIDWRDVPLAYKNKLSAVCRSAKECADLVNWYGDASFCPLLPVLIMVSGTQPTLIPGMGYATAAELRDCAVYAWFNQSDKIAKRGSVWDFNALREKNGLMRREDADAAIREALYARIRKHQANPVTDPFRQPQYIRPTNRTLVAVDGMKEKVT